MGTALLLGTTGALECLAIAPGERGRVATDRQEAAMLARHTTTLYDLITVLQAVVGPGDDALLVATVEHLLRSGRLTFPGTARTGRRRSPWSYW